MLPPDAVRTITIYPRWTSPIDGLTKPFRRVLRNCSWEERSIATALQTGQVLREPAVIRVFNDTSGLIFVPAHEWAKLPESELDGKWTCDLTQRPLITPFKSDHEFGWGTSAQVTTAENNFRRDNPGATTVVECNDNRKRLGSHIRMRAGG